ncbi:hypothetical protein BKA70DRAFT_1223596 [Coprinopsis sp. MPI-PUGE-AT-0042]|nr:hypothetical protein BKA70DRAFT_1223596 [Coprinopsis sp. MPI-PUGE-AT-0042]
MVTSVRRCSTSSTDRPVDGEVSTNLDGFARKEWDKTPPSSNARIQCGWLTGATPFLLATTPALPVYQHQMKRPAPPRPQAIALRDDILRLHFVDRIKTLDLFTTRHLRASLKTESAWHQKPFRLKMATKELLKIGLGQRLCAESVPTWEELQDVGTPSVNCFDMEIAGPSKGTIASGFQSTPETMDMRGQHNEYFQSRSCRHHRRHHPPTGAGRADLHLQDLVPLRQENNAGREFKQSRLCGNCRQQAIRILIRASDYNELDDTLSISSTKIPSPLALSVPTLCPPYTTCLSSSRHAYRKVTDITRQGEHENPDVCNDFLLPTQWSVTDQGTAVTFVRIRHPHIHTLRWFFANEDASSQGYTEDVEVELEVDTKSRLDGARVFVGSLGDGLAGARRMLCEKGDKDSAKFLAFRPGERGVDRLKNLLQFVGEHEVGEFVGWLHVKLNPRPQGGDPRIPTE